MNHTRAFVVALVGIAVGLAGSHAGAAELPAALRPALDQMKTQLSLDDDQVTRAEGLIGGQVVRIEDAVERFGDVSFDSVLDLMVEVRSVKNDFIPELKGLLNDNQKAKLGQLPKSHEMWVSAMAGWLTEGRLKKLAKRLSLSDAQLPEVREVLLEQGRDAFSIVVGVIAGGDVKKDILNAVVDLKGVVRQGERDVKKILTPEQRAAFEAVRDDSAKKEARDAS